MKTAKKRTNSKAIIKRDKALIDKALRKYLKRLKGPRVLRKVMEYAVFSGGKRLRPILTIESCRALKGDIKKALPFACAVELIHNFSLIHDDLPAMDNDDSRRGKPTCHRKFGEGLAILAGDGLLNLAFGIVTKFKQKKSLEIASFLVDAIGSENMIGGQALDIECRGRPARNRKLKNKIDSMKTAALMAVSCKIGALITPAKPKNIRKMHEFGMNLGLAFQIADDIKDSAHKKPALNKMKNEVKFFISKGKKYIKTLNKRADTLSYIADSVLEKSKQLRIKKDANR